MSNVHPNYIKSSNIILSTIVIACIILLLKSTSFTIARTIGAMVSTFIIIGTLAYLVRKGYIWVKYLLLAFSIIGTLPALFLALSENTIVGILNITQIILQTWAVVLLFKVPKSVETSTDVTA